MAVVRWDPFRDLNMLQDRMNRMFDDAGRGWRNGDEPAATTTWSPAVDIFETDDLLTIVIALPGVDPDRVQVTLSAGVLIVSGERPLPEELGDARIHRLEIPHGHFQRRIELPPARLELSRRHLANGCLMLQLQKVW